MPGVRRRLLLGGTAAVILTIGGRRRAASHEALPSGDAAPPLGSEIAFELSDVDGTIVRAADFRGWWLLVFFGYTSCPDLCPTTMSEIAVALAQLGPLAARLRPIFISIDPERDTPKVLRDYAKGFDGRIVPLTGGADRLAQATRSFGIVFYKVPGAAPGEYTFAHNAITTLVGPEGGLVTRFQQTPRQIGWLRSCAS